MKQRLALNDAYISSLCMELGCMLRAGMPPAQGLALLAADDDAPASRALLETAVAALEEGLPLSRALARAGRFPTYLLRTLALAEKTGRMESALLSLSDYYERQRLLRLSLRQALLYPLVLLAVFLCVTVVLLTQVLPIFDRVFRQLGLTLSGPARWMLTLGEGLRAAGGGIAIALAVLALLALLLLTVPRLRRGARDLLYRRGGGRGVWGLIARARFAAALSTGLAAGLGAEESIDSAAGLVAGCRSLDAGVERCRASLARGESLDAALRSAGIFTAMQSRMLALGFETGGIDQMMAEIARRADREAQERLDALVSAIEPAIVILTTLVAGVLLLAVMLPLLSIMGGM